MIIGFSLYCCSTYWGLFAHFIRSRTVGEVLLNSSIDGTGSSCYVVNSFWGWIFSSSFFDYFLESLALVLDNTYFPGDKRFVTLLKANDELLYILLLAESLLKVGLSKLTIVYDSLTWESEFSYYAPPSLTVAQSSLICLACTLLLLKSLNC